jgi:hypothetical protein
MSDVVHDYLELGLRLGRHLDGLVDSYYGPGEIKERTDREEPVDPKSLAGDAARLLGELGDLEESRRNWLRGQLVGLEAAARKLAGEEIAYEDEVELYYGVRPRWTPEAEFEDVHRMLDDALPGDGTLEERYRVWRDEDTIPADHVEVVIDRLAEDARERASAATGLPPDESVEFRYVSDEPWAAFNYYLGGLQSRIEVNTDIQMVPDSVVEIVAHETYPGHHAEHAWKEQVFVRDRGQLEETIVLIPTPQSMISEGIASVAPEVAYGDERFEVTAEHVSDTGVPYDPDVSRVGMEARVRLGRVSTNAALMIHVEGASLDDAQAYIQRWALATDKRAAHIVQFIADPMWRTYATTYTDGYDVCKEFVDGDPQRFRRLLTEQLTPPDLFGEANK